MEHSTEHVFYFILTCALLASVTSFIAQKFHFYHLKRRPYKPLRFTRPIVGFIGYIIVTFLAAPLGGQWVHFTCKGILQAYPSLLLTLTQILIFSFTGIYLFFFCLIQPKETLKTLFISPQRRPAHYLLADWGLGMLTWIIAFPIITFVSQSMEWIAYLITKTPRIEQLAIQYFRLIKDSPSLLAIALVMVLLLAPVIEELVFRGFLYSYLKQKIGLKKALLVSAFLFALFHFAPSQGMSNLPLLSSLFILALYLGFLYEKRSSLLAPIALHMTFNSISVMRILLFSN